MRATSGATDTAFAAERAAIRDLLAQPVTHEPTVWHQIGIHVRRVARDPKRYGVDAVLRLADETGIAAATLYRHAAITEDACRLHTEAAGATPVREPLPWSHVVARARTAATSLRRNADSLSFTQQPAEQERAGEASPRISLTQGIALASRAVRELRAFIEATENALPADAGEEGSLAHAIDALADLEETVVACLRSLQDATRASGQRLRAAPRVEETAFSEDDEQAGG